MHDPNILRNKTEIMKVLGVGEKRFKTLLRAGLPATKHGKSYMSNKQALLEWISRQN